MQQLLLIGFVFCRQVQGMHCFWALCAASLAGLVSSAPVGEALETSKPVSTTSTSPNPTSSPHERRTTLPDLWRREDETSRPASLTATSSDPTTSPHERRKSSLDLSTSTVGSEGEGKPKVRRRLPQAPSADKRLAEKGKQPSAQRRDSGSRLSHAEEERKKVIEVIPVRETAPLQEHAGGDALSKRAEKEEEASHDEEEEGESGSKSEHHDEKAEEHHHFEAVDVDRDSRWDLTGNNWEGDGQAYVPPEELKEMAHHDLHHAEGLVNVPHEKLKWFGVKYVPEHCLHDPQFNDGSEDDISPL